MKGYSSHTMALWSSRSFLTLEEDSKESSWGKAAKSSTKYQPKCGGLQWPDRAVTIGDTTTIRGIGHKLSA